MLDLDNLPPELQAQILSMVNDYEEKHPKCRACGSEQAEEGSEYCAACNAEIRAFRAKFPELFTGEEESGEEYEPDEEEYEDEPVSEEPRKNSPDGPFDYRPECVCVPVERYDKASNELYPSSAKLGYLGNDIYYVRDGGVVVYPGNGEPYKLLSGVNDIYGAIWGIGVNIMGVFLRIEDGRLVWYTHEGVFNSIIKLPSDTSAYYIYNTRIYCHTEKGTIETAALSNPQWETVFDKEKVKSFIKENTPSFVKEDLTEARRYYASTGARTTCKLEPEDDYIRGFWGDDRYLIVRTSIYYRIETKEECYGDGSIAADLMIDTQTGEMNYLSCDKHDNNIIAYDLENNAMYLCSSGHDFSKIPIGRPENGPMGTEALRAGRITETILGTLPASFTMGRSALVYSDTQLYYSPVYNTFYSIYAAPETYEYTSSEWNRSGHGNCGIPVYLGKYIYEDLDEFYGRKYPTLLPAVSEYPDDGRLELKNF